MHFVIDQQEISNFIGDYPEKADSLKLQLETLITKGRIRNEVDCKFLVG